jgi:uncharacterized membrane protein required for colicin V production
MVQTALPPVLSTLPGWVELLVPLVAGLLVLNGARRGFLREGSLVASFILAIWIAGRVYRPAQLLILHQASPGPVGAALYAALALVLVICAAGLSALLAPLVRRGPIRLVDRVVGGLVGLGADGYATWRIGRYADRELLPLARR